MSFGFFSNSLKERPAQMRERSHFVGGREMPLRIIENGRARRLTLRVDAAGLLRVTVPPGVSEREIGNFINRHQGWLEKKVGALPDQPDVRAGIKIPIFGVPHLVVHETSGRGSAMIRNGESGPELVVFGEKRFLKRRVADFLKKSAKAAIEPLVARHTETVGRRAIKISYRDTSSRWGSCSSDGKLSFSWRIAMAPKPVIDYLVAHEVAHLREMNHGPKFWKLCEKLCPRTDEAKTWLRKNGRALQAIRF